MSDASTPQQQVWAAELAFAASMARRDLAAFAAYVDDEAVFFSAEQPLRGKPQVVAGWSRYFQDAQAPFSWEPDQVEALPSGMLAFSTGVVRDSDGRAIARFHSIWRRGPTGAWTVVFDKGSPLP